MVQIIILEIAGKDSKFYGSLRKLHLLWAHPSNDPSKWLWSKTFAIVSEISSSQIQHLSVFKNSDVSEVVRVSSFFIMKVTRNYFQHSNEFSHCVHSSMVWKKTPISGFQFPQLQGKTAVLMFFNHGCSQTGRIFSHCLHLLQSPAQTPNQSKLRMGYSFEHRCFWSLHCSCQHLAW